MAATSTLNRNFPTLRYLGTPFRWLFGSRRRALTAAAVLLAMVAAPPLWWSTQLLGLPDVGEPFDVEAFRSFSIPEDRNAFVLYRRAADRLKAPPLSRLAGNASIGRQARWSKADPEVRRWLEDNPEAMDLYRRGADRPDAILPASPHLLRSYELLTALHRFRDLALLEASRREEQGDVAGAWDWYRALLRASSHVGYRGTTHERNTAQSWLTALLDRLGPWAADPRTTPDLLRRALDDVIACEALTPSDSYTLKAEYQTLEGFLGDQHNPAREWLRFRLRQLQLGATTYELDPDLIRALVDSWHVWRREPERSRRVLRLVIANWLAYFDRPSDRRPAPDPDVSGSFDFYAFGPEASAGARAVSPASLDRWLSSTFDAQELLRRLDLRALRFKERANHRALVVLLASQLYRRDHGSDPPSDEALVGPYLKALPDGDP